MLKMLTAYGTTLVVFLAIDSVWLGLIARNFYFDRLRPLMLDQPNWAAAGGFYAVYVIGIVIFAVWPALRGDSWWTALSMGALFGFFAYATYDMTNYATLRNWPVELVVVDVAWGAVLTGTAAMLGFFLTRLLPV